MFINKTIGELLFDGYDDPVLEIGASFDEEEKKLPMEKFGWFYKVVYVFINFTCCIFQILNPQFSSKRP